MKYLAVLFFILISCENKTTSQDADSHEEKKNTLKISSEDSLKIAEYWKKADQAGLFSTKRQTYLDSALMIKPDSAYFWQQKAMPLYKQRKYSLGKPFLAKAVEYNPEKWLDYSAFMKCIFSKEYEESINEFMRAKELFRDSYVMDHSYNFYIGLNYLQLNQFNKAKEFLMKSQEQQFRDFPKDPPEEACHFLDWFYLGIVEYELGNYTAAIENFDMSLKVYKNFGDAMYFKAICLRNLDNLEEGKRLFELAFENNQNTINEDNVFYEVYPYQIFNRLSQMSRETK